MNAGIYVGAYHVANPLSSNGSAQANYFLNNGGKYVIAGKKFLGAFGMEHRKGVNICYGLSQQQMISWINDFITT